MLNQIQEIIKKSPNQELISRAFELAKTAYEGKRRVSGEEYINHAVRVALFLQEMSLDPVTIAAGLLHDILDKKQGSSKIEGLKKVEEAAGKETAFLVERVARLDSIHYSLANIGDKKDARFIQEKEENLKKMFFALGEDIRALLIELVSRLDNLSTLNYLSAKQQELYALETLKIFVPVADRLGVEKIRSKLEDLAFSHAYPKEYRWLEEEIKKRYAEREKHLDPFVSRLKKVLGQEKIKVLEISHRTKSYWSIYQKLLGYNMDFEKIHDLAALRIIANSVENCYRVLGIVHKHWEPLSKEIEDYIANPKPNGYRSLHTAVFSKDGEIIEVQIRTQEMHKEAEYGICAHWAYKEKINLQKQGKKFAWVKKVPEFWKNLKIDFFENQIFVFTPKGDVISLLKDSTAVDFAYAVHSDIGNKCEAAKVSGKLTSLSEPLQNGQVVEIITSKQKTPSPDWLKFVKTSLARSQIKKWLAKSESPAKIFAPTPKKVSFLGKLVEGVKKKIIKEKKPIISLTGQTGISVNYAKCCGPKPGDEVGAYITLTKSASLHKISCPNFQKLARKSPEKVIEASWE